MKIKCFLLGHYWMFPNTFSHPAYTELIKKAKCKRCGAEKYMLCFIGGKGDVLIYWE